MLRASTIIFLFGTLLSAQIYAFSPVVRLPGYAFDMSSVDDLELMAELCIIGEDEAEEIFCEGVLVGLVRGLKYADPPYGPLNQLTECSGETRSATFLVDGAPAAGLLAAFGLGYRGTDTKDTTIQVLLRGLWQTFECLGEPPKIPPMK